jgi:hypothetical protein
MPGKPKDKYWAEKEWLRKHGITSRVPAKFLRYVYWRDRVVAAVGLLLVIRLIWFFFHIGYL